MNMTLNFDVTNSAHQIQMTTIFHWMKHPHENFWVRHPQMLLCPEKMYYIYSIKTKIHKAKTFPPKNIFYSPNPKTWLRAWFWPLSSLRWKVRLNERSSFVCLGKSTSESDGNRTGRCHGCDYLNGYHDRTWWVSSFEWRRKLPGWDCSAQRAWNRWWHIFGKTVMFFCHHKHLALFGVPKIIYWIAFFIVSYDFKLVYCSQDRI